MSCQDSGTGCDAYILVSFKDMQREIFEHRNKHMVWCFHCGQNGHYRSMCPNTQNSVTDVTSVVPMPETFFMVGRPKAKSDVNSEGLGSSQAPR